MIANCISRLISPTFLLLICTIFAVSYLKRAERTVSQIPLQDTIFSKFDRDEKWIEWGSLYWSKGARCVSQSPNPNSHEVHEVEQFIPDIVCQPFCGRTFPRVAGGGWRVTGDGWRGAGGGWRVTGSGWRVTGGGWRVKNIYENKIL